MERIERAGTMRVTPDDGGAPRLIVEIERVEAGRIYNAHGVNLTREDYEGLIAWLPQLARALQQQHDAAEPITGELGAE
ncbi:MAG TPA: hypothetical protein VIL85_16480 [Thermomicrobiales bacterium]|jgi:hypothetical protein